MRVRGVAWGYAAACAIAAGGVGLGCGGGGGAGDARFPKRAEGCDVALFHETPDVPTENIGPVRARCAEDVSESDCIRTLKDQVCALGGDVVWGVGAPEKRDGKVHYLGRAAHTKRANVAPR